MAHEPMKLIDGERLGVELAADFVERRQRVVAVKCRVFDALGCHGSAHLLEFKCKLSPFGRLLVSKGWRMFEQQHGCDEVEN